MATENSQIAPPKKELYIIVIAHILLTECYDAFLSFWGSQVTFHHRSKFRTGKGRAGATRVGLRGPKALRSVLHLQVWNA